MTMHFTMQTENMNRYLAPWRQAVFTLIDQYIIYITHAHSTLISIVSELATYKTTSSSIIYCILSEKSIQTIATELSFPTLPFPQQYNRPKSIIETISNRILQEYLGCENTMNN